MVPQRNHPVGPAQMCRHLRGSTLQVSGDEEDVDAQLRRHLSFARQQTAAPGQLASEDFGAQQAEAGAEEGHVGAPNGAGASAGEVSVSVSEQAAVALETGLGAGQDRCQSAPSGGVPHLHLWGMCRPGSAQQDRAGWESPQVMQLWQQEGAVFASEQDGSSAPRGDRLGLCCSARQGGEGQGHSPLRIKRLWQLTCSVSQVSLLRCLRAAGTGAGGGVTVSLRLLWRQESRTRLLQSGWIRGMQQGGRRSPKTLQHPQVGCCVCGLACDGRPMRQAVWQCLIAACSGCLE